MRLTAGAGPDLPHSGIGKAWLGQVKAGCGRDSTK